MTGDFLVVSEISQNISRKTTKKLFSFYSSQMPNLQKRNYTSTENT